MAAMELDDVRAAAARLRPHLLPTPALESDWLSEAYGAPVTVLWESLQRTGSFKLRGALNKLLLLAERGASRDLAVSAGNHGLGVAWAARLLGFEATVVVPAGAAANKVAAIRRLGAAIEVLGRSYDEAEAAARALAASRPGVEFVSPYNDLDVVAGQATATLDLLAAARCDVLLVPAGGGGLLAGAVLAAQAARPVPAVYGVQPENAPALHEALPDRRRPLRQPRGGHGDAPLTSRRIPRARRRAVRARRGPRQWSRSISSIAPAWTASSFRKCQG